MLRLSDPPAIIEFGHFSILPRRRQLLADGRPIRLGGRAFDLLLALIESPGAVVGKDELLSRIWPGRIVEENRLQNEIWALRKAFGADRELIRTVSGRGYQFAGEIREAGVGVDARQVPASLAVPSPSRPMTNLSESISELIGREAALAEVTDLVTTHRLVTLIGEGGIGKTRLGLQVARKLLPEFADGVWVTELAPLADPALVPVAVATALGLELTGGAISPERVANMLGATRLLLVLDNCEHLVAAATEIAETLLRRNSTMRVLATSREPLQAEGEYLYRVPPLAVPAQGIEDVEEVLRHSSVRLFVARACAANPHFRSDGPSTAAAATICRRLDGIPLAIELAAARGAVLGTAEIAVGLDDRFHLLTGGHRRSLPRHQTLRATLDWSYELLPEPECVALRRLAIFAGGFTLAAASAVITETDVAASDVVHHLANLVAKSLVAADTGGSLTRYRLLETTRSYAFDKLTQSGELPSIVPRYVEYYRDFLATVQNNAAGHDQRVDYAPEIDNIRTALGWAFAPGANASMAVTLAAVAAPMWLRMSLLSECSGWTGKAVVSLDADCRGTRNEMVLQAALGFSLMFTKGMTGEARTALMRAVELAESLDDHDYQLRAIWGLYAFRQRVGDFRSALELARQYEAVADRVGNSAARRRADSMLGIALFFLGDLANARTHLQRGCDGHTPASGRADMVHLGIDARVYEFGYLGIIQWLQGFPNQAMEASRRSIDRAKTLQHSLSLCFATWVGSTISLRTGDLGSAKRYAATLAESAKHSATYRACGLSIEGVLFAIGGDVETGVQLLHASLEGMREGQYYIFYTMVLSDLARVLGASGRVEKGLLAIDEALGRTEHNAELWFMPEALRVKGELFLLQGAPGAAAAEDHFRQALDSSRRQDALSWELRAGTSLARLWRDHGRRREAQQLLARIYGRFTEGFETADLKAAKAVIDELE
jgi:predicted ATPase/DNA-binding winged helix-turn-helix (wHTH) protein